MRGSFKIARFVDSILRIVPVVGFLYLSKFNRISAFRLMVGHIVIIPFLGWMRYAYVRRRIVLRLKQSTKDNEETIRSSFDQMDIDFDDQTDYMLIINANSNNENQIYEKQKELKQLNKQLKQKQNQFSKVRILFTGSQQIYQILQQNQKQIIIQFYQTNKNSKISQISLLTKNNQGQLEILMQCPLNSKIQSIIKQISKHKYKAYVQAMSF